MDEDEGSSADDFQPSSSETGSSIAGGAPGHGELNDTDEEIDELPIRSRHTPYVPRADGVAKTQIVTETQSARRKRLRNHFNRRYLDLLNETIASVALPFDNPPEAKLGTSQFGGSIWTPDEKDIFFAALSRYGRDDLPNIARAVATKSALEVRDYLITLQDGFVEQNLYGAANELLSWADVPAAVEVGGDLEARLDLAAEVVKERVWGREAQREREKWGPLWQVDFDSASRLTLSGEEEGQRRKRPSHTSDEAELSESPPKRIKLEDDGPSPLLDGDEELREVAELFDLKRWVYLQETVFMNAGGDRADENWRIIAVETASPSILRTALVDFYGLVVTLIRRLISAAQFQAMMRLRAMDVRLERPVAHPSVTENDVLAALDTLDMVPSSHTFWIYTARRCGVRVTYGDEDELDYDEVEEELGVAPVMASSSESESDSSDPDLLDAPAARRQRLEQKLEDYAEALDERARLREEADLLEIFGNESKGAAPLAAPERPVMMKQTEAELVEWRDWTDRRRSWKTRDDASATVDTYHL